MQPALKTRLLGAAVLIALLVIIVPLFFSGKPGGSGSQSISLDIPQTPDQALETRTMSVGPTSAASTANSAQVTTTPGNGNQLATVDIASRVSHDAGPGDAAPQDASDASPAPDAAGEPDSDRDAGTPQRQASETASGSDADTAASRPGKAAVDAYRINLGAYGDKRNAERLVAKVQKMGYTVHLSRADIAGKPAARVDVGPFDSRAAAESARLKLHAALPQAPARLVSDPGNQPHNAPAPEKSATATGAGGWAVQVVAYSKQSDANQLRDKLRAAGFDSYVDDVKSGGKTLWRVRVGPQTRRADALAAQKHLKSEFPRLNGVVVDVP